MIRTQESTGKTVDEARAKACALLGVQADDLNVSYEVLEMPLYGAMIRTRSSAVTSRNVPTVSSTAQSYRSRTDT